MIRRQPSKNVPQFFTDIGVEIYYKSIIANRLNEYFVNIGTRLAAQIPTITSSSLEFMKNSYINSLCFYTTDPIEIVDIVTKLKILASSGYDSILVKVMKANIYDVAEPIYFKHNKLFTAYREIS